MSAKKAIKDLQNRLIFAEEKIFAMQGHLMGLTEAMNGHVENFEHKKKPAPKKLSTGRVPKTTRKAAVKKTSRKKAVGK